MKELIHVSFLVNLIRRTDLQYGLPAIWWWVMGEMFYPSLYNRATHYMKIYFLFLPTYYVEIQKGNGNVNIRLGERRCRFLLLSIHQVKCVYLLLSKKIKYSWTRFSFPPLFITWTYSALSCVPHCLCIHEIWNVVNINMSTRLIINTAAVCPASKSNTVVEQQQQKGTAFFPSIYVIVYISSSLYMALVVVKYEHIILTQDGK